MMALGIAEVLARGERPSIDLPKEAVVCVLMNIFQLRTQMLGCELPRSM